MFFKLIVNIIINCKILEAVLLKSRIKIRMVIIIFVVIWEFLVDIIR